MGDILGFRKGATDGLEGNVMSGFLKGIVSLFRGDDGKLSRRGIALFAGFVAAFGVGYVASYLWTDQARRETPLPSRRTVPPISPERARPRPALRFPETPAADPARRGDILFGQERYQEAIPFYRKALETDPRNADTWNDLGLALHYVGKNREAMDALRRGAKLTPPYQRIWLSLGFVAYRQGLLPEARAAWERAIAIAPSTDIAAEARKFLDRLR